MKPHEFVPGDVADWTGAHRFCDRCEMPQAHSIHNYEPADGDRSAQIMGENDDDPA